MKHYPAHIAHEKTLAPPAMPQFHAVPTRLRDDGWTPRRQAEFIGYLAQTRSVTEAARMVGMARETAYRLRRREWSESFCAAWDAALKPKTAQKTKPGGHSGKSHFGRSHCDKTPKRMVTNAELQWRIKTGLWQLRFYRGKFMMAWRKGDDSALFRLLARLDRAKPLRPEMVRRAAG